MLAASSTNRTPPFRRREAWILAGVWILSALYLLFFVNRGWIPGDEGLLGQSAERCLRGELPHVDYRDLYTGGLSLWHALAFRLLGIQVIATRLFLFGAALVFVPALFRVARRVASPLCAGLVTLLALAWSLPNYFSGMPSWYNLFFAVGGLLALTRHVETGRRRWLALAGLLAGLSFLVKSIGLLFVASVLLFLVYREQEEDAGSPFPPGEGKGAVLAFRLFATAGLSFFALFLAGFVLGQRPGPMEFVLLVLPGAALAVFLIHRTWARPSGPAALRFRRLLASGAIFFGGLLGPVVLFLVPYAERGELGELLRSGFLFQSSRLEHGVWALPGPATLICALPLALLFAWPAWRARRGGGVPAGGPASPFARPALLLVALAAVVVLAFSFHPFVYQTVWFSVRPLVPILVLAGLAALSSRASRSTDLEERGSVRRQHLFLVLAAVALASIVQFPYARALYFCYIAPLVALGWLFLARFQHGAPRRLHVVAGVFYGLFAVLWLNLGWVETMDYRFRPMDHAVHPDLERAHELRVSPGSARLYEDIVSLVHQHAGEGEPIYAGPDVPEIYFLSARPNPTPTILDFLDEDFGTDARRQRLLRLLEEKDVDVVVLRRIRIFTPLDQEFIAAVEERYPHVQPVGHFSVHWR